MIVFYITSKCKESSSKCQILLLTQVSDLLAEYVRCFIVTRDPRGSVERRHEGEGYSEQQHQQASTDHTGRTSKQIVTSCNYKRPNIGPNKLV